MLMKKYFYSALAAAAMLLATVSCSQEENFVEPTGQMTSFSVQLTGAPKSLTRDAGDGKTVDKLYYAVYQDGTKVFPANGNGSVGINTDLTAKVEMPLLKGEEYDIIFWAQKEGVGVYNISDLTSITVDYTNALSNQESYDAFYNALNDFKADNKVHTIELRRPFAQLNLGTSDWERAKEALKTTADPVTHSHVVVKGLANTFAPLTGVASGDETVTFKAAAINTENFTVNNKTYKNLALNYLLVPCEKAPQGEGDHIAIPATEKALVDIDFVLYRGEGNVLFAMDKISNVPVQRNYRTNVIGQLLTGTEFDIIIKPETDEPSSNIEIKQIKTSEELVAALDSDDENIVIELLAATTRSANSVFNIAVSSWVEKYYLGGENTKTITINANGNTINFVQHDSDWNYVRLANPDAKLIINDAHLTNSGKNTGHWKRNLIRFFNKLELNEVTSEKGLCMMNDATLTDLDINVADENYALWITAQGQNVVIDGLNVVATNAGRAIKIGDEDYKDVAEKISLIAKNATFETAKKAAILVSSKAGADICLENIDLSKVSADKFNAVWIDEEWEEYKDLVSVEGGFVTLESTTSANPFAEDNAEVTIPAGTYGTFPVVTGKNVKILANGAVFTGNSGLNINGATVEGATFSNAEGSAIGGTINGTFKDCTFTGSNALRWCYAGEITVFEDCVFDGSVYGVHFDGGSNPVIFRRCTFSGFNAFGGEITLLTLQDCTFKSTGKSSYNGANLWGKTELNGTKFMFDGTAKTEWIGINATEGICFTDCTILEDGKNLFDCFANISSEHKVTIDGVEYILEKELFAEGVVKSGDERTYYLTNASSFIWAEKQKDNFFAGKTIKLANDINMTGVTIEKPIHFWNPENRTIVDGQNYTISNLTMSTTSTEKKPFGLFGGTADIKNLRFNNANVSGYSYVAVVAGNLYGNVENCHVVNSAVTGTYWMVGAMSGQYNAGNVTNCSVTNTTINGPAAVGALIGCINETTGERKVENCTVTGCTIVQNGSFGGDYDEMFGTAVGLINIDNSTAEFNKCYVEATTVKEIESNELFGVNGGTNTKIFVNGKVIVYTAEQLTDAINNGATDIILAGEIKMPNNATNKSITITGMNSASVIDVTGGAYWDGATLTFNNIKFKTSTGMSGSDYAALYSKDVTYNNCNFSGSMRIGRDGAKFVGCTFNDLGSDYIWTMGNDATFDGCTFNTAGKAILIYSDGGSEVSKVTVKNCTFNATQGAKAGAIANQNCAAIEIHNYGNGVNLITSGNIHDSNFSGEWRIKTYETGKPAIIVNGIEYTTIALDGKTMTIDENRNVTVNN